MIFLAQTDSAQFWNQLLSGQVGFILATLVFGGFFWKVLLPRWDRQTVALDNHTKSLEKLGDAVRILVAYVLEKEGKKPEEIIKRVDEIRGL